MKLKLSLFGLLLLLALAPTALHAQQEIKYEYAALIVPITAAGDVLFIPPSGEEVLMKSGEYPSKVIGGREKGTINKFYMLTDFINRKAEEGWEPVMPVNDGVYVLLRRPRK